MRCMLQILFDESTPQGNLNQTKTSYRISYLPLVKTHVSTPKIDVNTHKGGAVLSLYRF